MGCFQCSVEAFNDVRARLKDEDEWKISFRDLNQTAYSSLMGVLLKQGKRVEALYAAEQGRAQALEDLMLTKYQLETACCHFRSQEQTISDLLRSPLPNTVFTAIKEGLLLFWVIQNGKDVNLRIRETTDSQVEDMISFLDSLVKTAHNEIGVRAGVKCEDRSLDKLRNENLTNKGSDKLQSFSTQTPALRTLHEIVIGPISDLIQGDELIIVPEGPLWLAPYAAFVDSNLKHLSESTKIRIIPSLKSLKLILDCPANYHSKNGALLVGDPWVQDVCSHQNGKLQQLPYAKKEVEMIGRILNTAPLTGTEATKDVVLSQLSSAALVHIAAHGRMETGEIALAPSPTRTSRIPQEEDFLLTMADVLKVKLRAKLVVLSCCHSGRGEIKAEGVVGIARAFLGAGARSVLVSLWAIDDEATLEFMNNFYQHLVKGRSASEALNRAMKCLRESEQFSEMRFWAPFVLIGDSVTLEFGASK